jgi:hypothetical protein
MVALVAAKAPGPARTLLEEGPLHQLGIKTGIFNLRHLRELCDFQFK